MTDDDLLAHARGIIASNHYLVLGTTGPDGHPWTAPVYFAPSGDRHYYWVSEQDAVHSGHLAAHPRVSMVVFDSTVAPYHGRAVYAVGRRGRWPVRTSSTRCAAIPGPTVAGPHR